MLQKEQQQHILISASTGTKLVQGYLIWNIKFWKFHYQQSTKIMLFKLCWLGLD